MCVVHTETQTAATMLSGSSAQVFVMPTAGLLVGGAGGGDDPSRYPPWGIKSVHELDAAAVVPAAALRGKRPAAAAGGPLETFQWQCPICDRTFPTEKSVHGHMRCHRDRGWRGMEVPRPPPLGELAADGKRYRYVCDYCKAAFETRQALGGHRASHNGRKGCSWYSKQELADAAGAAAGGGAQKPFKLPFDLNDPAPEE